MNIAKRNDALRVNGNMVNGKSVDIHQTVRGSDFYWAICAVMGFSTLAFLILAMKKARPDRIFHYITASVCMIAFITYFTMAANLGWTPIDVEFRRSRHTVSGINREIFYVRYIDWFITTPLLLSNLLLTAAMPWPTILWVLLVDEVMIVCGLVGALTRTRYKWGYFAFGCAALMYILYQLVWEARRHANALGRDVGRTFLICGSLLSFLWLLYPISWGLCEGGNYIAPDSEAVFYGVLDFFAKPIFGALLLWGHRNVDPARLGLRIRDYDEDPAVHGSLGGPYNREKVAPGGVHNEVNNSLDNNGVHNGVHNNGVSTGFHTGAQDGIFHGARTGHTGLEPAV
ncbi:family A G protein-coupled receptor-like protein [Patellaria atrata CBS 101060]|uniref:Family A G protein-coupled receptor-like protein n=1 Tax=Patellaria atrata CBS 101060 TaxID=1346257 RepID=A0A9P4VRS1_9PEZI|nr:family A G protein-coupled receptor-like protein [Patellaria atrata CBS 101060]